MSRHPSKHNGKCYSPFYGDYCVSLKVLVVIRVVRVDLQGNVTSVFLVTILISVRIALKQGRQDQVNTALTILCKSF